MEAGVRIFPLCRNRTRLCSLIAASRTLATNQFQPSLSSFPLKQHRFMSQESAAGENPIPAFEGSQRHFSKPRDIFERQEFPSAKGPLNSQTWRQFLTSDEKTIVCVHPAKSVPIQDTKPLRPLKPWVKQQRSQLTDDEISIVQRLRNEDASLWTINTLARFFNVKRAVISKVAPANLDRQSQLEEEKALMSRLKPYRRRLLRTRRQMEREKRLEAVIAQSKELSSIRDKYRLQP